MACFSHRKRKVMLSVSDMDVFACLYQKRWGIKNFPRMQRSHKEYSDMLARSFQKKGGRVMRLSKAGCNAQIRGGMDQLGPKWPKNPVFW